MDVCFKNYEKTQIIVKNNNDTYPFIIRLSADETTLYLKTDFVWISDKLPNSSHLMEAVCFITSNFNVEAILVDHDILPTVELQSIGFNDFLSWDFHQFYAFELPNCLGNTYAYYLNDHSKIKRNLISFELIQTSLKTFQNQYPTFNFSFANHFKIAFYYDGSRSKIHLQFKEGKLVAFEEEKKEIYPFNTKEETYQTLQTITREIEKNNRLNHLFHPPNGYTLDYLTHMVEVKEDNDQTFIWETLCKTNDPTRIENTLARAYRDKVKLDKLTVDILSLFTLFDHTFILIKGQKIFAYRSPELAYEGFHKFVSNLTKLRLTNFQEKMKGK